MTKLTMKSAAAHDGKAGAAWYLLPAFWMAIAAGGLLFLSHSMDAPREVVLAVPVAAAAVADSGSAVPAASSVFSPGYWEMVNDVQQF
jgi:hypothetical protein